MCMCMRVVEQRSICSALTNRLEFVVEQWEEAPAVT